MIGEGVEEAVVIVQIEVDDEEVQGHLHKQKEAAEEHHQNDGSLSQIFLLKWNGKKLRIYFATM